MRLALHILDLPRGSEVITSPVTFVSTNHAILHAGCRPVFADIQRDTGNLDVRSVAEHISDRTRAVIAVHYGGYPCDLDEIYALARKHRLRVIEDCAHAFGASYKGTRIGGRGDLQAFSFQAVKNLCTGDGGAIALRSEADGSRLKRLRWLGIDKDTWSRRRMHRYSWEYDVTEVGYKAQMNDIEATIGLAQLPYVDEENARRAELSALYRDRLTGVPGVRLLRRQEDRASSCHLFAILVERREDLVEKFRAESVEVGIHYRRNDDYVMYERQWAPRSWIASP